jgi:hypothetical protein
MTVCELRKLLETKAPNADVYLALDLPSHVVPLNVPVVGVRNEGQLVFLDGLSDER